VMGFAQSLGICWHLQQHLQWKRYGLSYRTM
jgi:hypothetical protein